jgi:hypothetical protein
MCRRALLLVGFFVLLFGYVILLVLTGNVLV